MKNVLRSFAVLAFLLAAQPGHSQAWNTVGSGLSQNVWSPVSCTDNGNVYVAYLNLYDINLERWNGLNWVSYPSFVPPPQTWSPPNAIAVYNGDIYVGTSSSLLKFDGTTWSTIGNGGTYVLEVINNELFIGVHDSIMTYNGTSFTGMPALPNGFSVRDVEYFGGDYYVSGVDSAYVNSPISTLKLDGATWTSPANFFSGTPFDLGSWWSAQIFSYNADLYVTYYGKLYRVANDTAYYLAAVHENIRDEVEYNGLTYLLSDSMSMNGGASFFDGTTVTQIVGGPVNLTTGVNYNNELIVFSNQAQTFNGMNFNHAFRTQAGFSVLNGTVYMDANSDCFFNSSETTVPQFIIGLNDSDVFVTNSAGEYSLGVEQGTYSFDTLYSSHSIGKNLDVTCSVPSSIAVGANQTITQNIGINNTVATDMQTFISAYWGWRARYGFSNHYRVDVNNTGNSTAGSVTVNVVIPPTVTVQSVNPPASNINGNVYSFDFLNIQPLESKEIDIEVKVDTATNSMGDTLVWTSYLSTVTGDADLADNADTLTQTVTAAFDPNDKQASAYSILPNTEKIDYQIRFQNTGTDTALKVVVVDTLDMTLPITRVIINSASHPYSLSVKNNILIWEFDNIMLPDSSTDLAGSQGYIRFSAGIAPGLSVGDTIRNDAHIFFDYQHPIHTNTAKTAVVNSISLVEHDKDAALIRVYPNPARDILYLSNDEGTETVEFVLRDQMGRVLDRITVKPGVETEYRISGLATGLYILSSPTQSHKVIISR